LLASEPPANFLSKIQHLEKQLSQIQAEKDQKVAELATEKETLQNDLTELSEQNTILRQKKSQIATEKNQIINQLTQDLAKEREQKNIVENNLAQEKEISAKQKQTINDLQHQLQTERETSTNLMQKLHASEQNYSNLQTAYQNAIKAKQTTEILLESEKQRADNYEQQLKTITKAFHH